MKKYALLAFLLFCGNIGFSQKYWVYSIEEGIEKGADNVDLLEIRVKKGQTIDFSKLVLFKNLTKLHIYNLDFFPREITQLANLQGLILDNSKKSYILPKEIFKLTKIHQFKADSVSALPEELFELTNMKTLYLNGNFNKISKSIGKLSNLESLYLESTKGFVLPHEIQKLQKLKYFTLKNPEAVFTKSIYSLSDLWTFHIKSTKAHKISDSLSNLKNLKSLRIDAPIKSLPNTIGDLTELRDIILLNCQLMDLPASMQKLTRLRELFIINSSLPKIPSVIYSIPQLSMLMLDGNRIEKVEDDWIKLIFLMSFSACNNPIKSLPLNLPPKLESISISNTLITNIPYHWHSGKRTQYFLNYIEAYNTPIPLEEQTKIQETTHIKVFLGKKELVYDYNR